MPKPDYTHLQNSRSCLLHLSCFQKILIIRNTNSVSIMKKAFNGTIKLLKRSYYRSLRSIAFYPVLISIGLFVFAILTLSVENAEIVQGLKKSTPYLFIEDRDTARTVLSTLIAGILSLTVFSFSMVMVVLSQASSNFSPRLLPGLISNREHQLILGVYIGTLLYCIIILISLGVYKTGENAIGLSTTFSAILGILCVVLFVSFIHNISRSIQIQNIIERIFRKSEILLDRELSTDSGGTIGLKQIADDDRFIIPMKETGYFQGFDNRIMSEALLQKDLRLSILPYVGQHLWEGEPFARTSSPLTEEEIEDLHFCASISENLQDIDNYNAGLIKLMEIAVRAMSPGINDPGTTRDVIDKVGQLIAKVLKLPHITSNKLKDSGTIVVKHTISATQLMRLVIQPIRQYSKEDISVNYELIRVLYFLRSLNYNTPASIEGIEEEINALKEDIEKSVTNSSDRRQIFKVFQDLKM